MTAADSLHRIGQAFKPKPKADQIKEMADKLNIEVTPDLLKLDDNEAITNALVEIATQAGKTEDEIAAALGWVNFNKISPKVIFWNHIFKFIKIDYVEKTKI